LKINENRKRKERKKKKSEERTVTVPQQPRTDQPGTNASSTLLDAEAHIVGTGCLQGSLGCRMLPEAEKSHNIKEANIGYRQILNRKG